MTNFWDYSTLFSLCVSLQAFHNKGSRIKDNKGILDQKTDQLTEKTCRFFVWGGVGKSCVDFYEFLLESLDKYKF